LEWHSELPTWSAGSQVAHSACREALSASDRRGGLRRPLRGKAAGGARRGIGLTVLPRSVIFHMKAMRSVGGRNSILIGLVRGAKVPFLRRCTYCGRFPGNPRSTSRCPRRPCRVSQGRTGRAYHELWRQLHRLEPSILPSVPAVLQSFAGYVWTEAAPVISMPVISIWLLYF
jgi:hypothetical protein